MSKLFLSFSLLFILTISANAQYNLTQANYAVIGDTMYYSLADTTGQTPGAAGTGAAWNYAGLSRLGTSLLVTMRTPSTMTGGTGFPSSTIGYSDNGGGYEFHKVDATSAYQMGEKSRTNTLMTYSDSAKIFAFPFAYGDSIGDSVVGTYPDPFGGTVYRKGLVVTEYDGSGTLTTPFGTYPNAIRIHRIWTSRDSASIAAVIGDIIFDEYEWYSQGTTLPVMRNTFESTSINAGNPTIARSIIFFDSPPVSVIPNNFSSIATVSPNPSKGFSQLQFGLKNHERVSIILKDLNGKTIQTVLEGNLNSGENQVSLSTNGVAPGLYIIEINTQNQKQSLKWLLN